MANTSNSSNSISALIPTERYFQFGVYLSCGTLSFVGNTLIGLAIAGRRELRSRFYVIIVSLLLCRVLMCVQLISLSVYRFFKALDLIDFPSRFACAWMALFLYPGTLELLLLLVLALDRAMALFMMNYYRTLTCRHAVWMCAVIALIPLVLKLALLHGDPSLMAKVTCFSIFDAVPTSNVLLSQNLDLALLGVLLAAYFTILIAVRSRVKILRSNEAALVAINRHLSLMPTVRNIIVVHCAWTLSAKVLLSLSLMPFAEAYKARFLLYGGFFVASELFVNVVILLYTNLDIRSATVDFCRCRKERMIWVSAYYYRMMDRSRSVTVEECDTSVP